MGSKLVASVAAIALLGLAPVAQAQDEDLFGEDDLRPDAVDPDDTVELEPLAPRTTPKDPPAQTLAAPIPQRASPLTLNAGVTLRQRSFTVDSVDANLDFSSSLYPTIGIGAAVFPFSTEGWLGSLGLEASFARGIDTTTIDEGGVIRKVPTRHSEIGAALVTRHRVTDTFLIEGHTGLFLLDFVLADNPFYSSTTYRAWLLSTKGVYTASSWLDVTGGLELYPLVSLGASEAEFGQDSSTFGASASLALEADIAGGLYAHGGYQLTAFSSTFTGRGARGLESAVTTDVFHSISAWAGYRF